MAIECNRLVQSYYLTVSGKNYFHGRVHCFMVLCFLVFSFDVEALLCSDFALKQRYLSHWRTARSVYPTYVLVLVTVQYISTCDSPVYHYYIKFRLYHRILDCTIKFFKLCQPQISFFPIQMISISHCKFINQTAKFSEIWPHTMAKLEIIACD